jgi:uncharacterized integral membrane protein
MRVIYGLLLLAFLAVLGIFAYQNDESVSVRFFDWAAPASLAAVAGASYVLGMFSGWTVVGFVRRSLQRVTARSRN